ncbi:MAG: winged-helix domain-containing protein [Solirubrobacteraceae bacterium]
MLIADGFERRVRERAEQLALDGWPVRVARRPHDARELLAGAEVLVLGEFGGSAVLAQELLRDLRASGVAGTDRRLRVLATADTDAEIVSALSAGADMTVPRSGSVTVVSASVAALARRGELPPSPEPVRVGALEIDAAGQAVRFNGEAVQLANREMQVLVVLAQQPGRVFTRDEISREVWGGPDLKSSRALDSHVSRMAAKFRAAGGDRVVENVRGRGYKLNNAQGVEL